MTALFSSTLQIDNLLAALQADEACWINKIEHFDEINSTNTYLMQHESPLHGRVCVADHQTQGRGRQGKQWLSKTGNSLMFSLGYTPKNRLGAQLSLVVGLAIADVLRDLGVAELGLKWPNDVLVNHKKVAGILIESRYVGKQAECVIGVGLNIDFTPAQLAEISRPCISLAQLDIKQISKQSLLIQIIRSICKRLAQFQKKGFASIRLDWLAYHVYINRQVHYEQDGETRLGRIVDLGKKGELMLEHDGKIHQVTSGEINTIRGVS